VTETDLALDHGRTLHVYDTGTGDGTTGLAVFWQHGAPSTGAPPEPLFAATAERGIRWVSHDRPGYGGSTPHPGRDVASAAADVASVADALGIDRFAVMGDSGGGPYAAFGAWSWLGTVAGQALATDQGGMVDDDLAYVAPWGCDPGEISTPVLLVHGAQDRLVPSSHATWLAQRCRTAELWLRPDDGHVSILNSSVMALDWLCEHASHR
jgi:pimeloyl-ACP methyl ester carboxylesterase